MAGEPQVLPDAGENALVETVGLHTKHGLPAASAPAGTHTPLTRQPSHVLTQVSDALSHAVPAGQVLTGELHVSVSSSQVELPLHAMPSSHWRA